MSDLAIQDPGTITLKVQPGALVRFFALCQQGFLVKVPASGSIRTILCRDLGLSQDYLEGRIQTIFLNGKAVDDLDAAMVGQGDTLALSAALPGLVGATMRRGGYLAGLRANISHREPAQTMAGGECIVTLKLFNLLTHELGPFFLRQGVWIKPSVFEDFLRRQPEDFWGGLLAAEFNGEAFDLRNLPAMIRPQEEALVRLRVVVNRK